ncbi:CDGSH iron-sulfur domain-containing protein [Arthrobacter sp. ATA002]|uniref:CDGSH iron-sulfur domain-containing protein n=1 Tax=Arthrobacter sp. ATA002 TaxID=2991715 RepID=UPI003FA43583
MVACPNGPLLVRGDFEIVTPEGVPIPRDRGTVALCRCGGSAIKPYCDGTHKLMKFDTSRRRPVPAAVVERSGGAPPDRSTGRPQDSPRGKRQKAPRSEDRGAADVPHHPQMTRPITWWALWGSNPRPTD